VKIFLNQENKIKNIWWVAFFFLILASCLFPLIILADRFSFEITMAQQLIIIAIVSIICQLFRRKPIGELTGNLNLMWLKEFFKGLLVSSIGMQIFFLFPCYGPASQFY